ncbi:MAG: pyridoxal phosphate-dependent aminotransferase [Planctomycetota bacterium]|jgi:aspartate/methionine/tyrosine aminotransferase|nr:pyridoxal phosphate-dependent aminotransferase [Planctomycetota bacterium]MDP6762383.1 pyridoxal phosphate-dependent aminotransferase [Planctomycetota bacterium]MDP6988844.1 pyridoxal phosphate-dependent aminotransferase [Planctomycetota bacterium]
MSQHERLQFPYMFWAHTESWKSPYCLSQSGMPAPDTEVFDGLGVDLSHPAAEALPELTARLGELLAVDPERVLVTPGASAAMHLCALRYFRPGARVVVDVPSYEPFRALPTLVGAETALVRRRAAEGWTVDPSQVRARLSDAAGRGHAFLTNPNNPTGALMEPERARALAAEAARADGVLVSCEVYTEYLPPDTRSHAFALAPNAISIGSLTKAYGLGPLRIGWLVVGEGLVGEMRHLVDMAYLAYVDPPTVSLRAGARALAHLPELLQPLRRIERESRPLWERWLAETPGIEAVVPDHGIIAFPRVVGVEDTASLVRFLQDEWQVDVVPGEFFGLPGHLRVGCGVPTETLREGLRRLGEGIAAFRGGG